MEYVVTYMQWPAVGNQRLVVEADNEDHAEYLCKVLINAGVAIRSVEPNKENDNAKSN